MSIFASFHQLNSSWRFYVRHVDADLGIWPFGCANLDSGDVLQDAGGVARAKLFMESLNNMNVQNISLAITIKHRYPET